MGTTAKPKTREIISFDYAMKNILRDKANSGILEGFLSELLRRKVTVIAILESEANKDNEDDKINRVDIKAQIDDGEIVIIEIQYADLYDFFGKMVFNVSKAIVEQIKIGGKYDIKKVYMIGIADFELGAEREYLFHAKTDGFKGIHYDETIPFAQTRCGAAPSKAPKFDIHPEYYLVLPQKFDDEIRTRFDEWVYALKNHEVKSEFSAAGIEEAAEKMEFQKMTPEEKKAYERHLWNKHEYEGSLETAEMKGEARGIAKGRAKGKAEADEMWKTVVAEKDAALADQAAALADKDAALAAALAEIERLKNV